MKKYSERLKMNILLPEYPGFEVYDKLEHSEKLINERIPSIYEYLVNYLGYNPKNIYILRRSLSTGIGIYLFHFKV